jgi:hypothetical protein
VAEAQPPPHAVAPPQPTPRHAPRAFARRAPHDTPHAARAAAHAASAVRGSCARAQTADDLVASRTFFYVRAETDELLYFGMVNSLFSLMLESEPSNHLHSLLIPKAYLA